MASQNQNIKPQSIPRARTLSHSGNDSTHFHVNSGIFEKELNIIRNDGLNIMHRILAKSERTGYAENRYGTYQTVEKFCNG